MKKNSKLCRRCRKQIKGTVFSETTSIKKNGEWNCRYLDIKCREIEFTEQCNLKAIEMAKSTENQRQQRIWEAESLLKRYAPELLKTK